MKNEYGMKGFVVTTTCRRGSIIFTLRSIDACLLERLVMRSLYHGNLIQKLSDRWLKVKFLRLDLYRKMMCLLRTDFLDFAHGKCVLHVHSTNGLESKVLDRSLPGNPRHRVI